jgi:hypothetical protein
MKGHSMNKLFLSAALLTALTVPSAAAVITETDFTTNATGVLANPNDDLAIATSVGVSRWTANEVIDSLGGLAAGDLLSITNPLPTAIGGQITISWDGGVFTDTTTTHSVSFVGDELDLAGSGTLFGPGIPAGTTGVLDLSFTQAGGTGRLISGSGSFTATVGSAIPEPSTWAMMLLGAVGLAYAARSRKRDIPGIA